MGKVENSDLKTTTTETEDNFSDKKVLRLLITGLDEFDLKGITADKNEIRLSLESNSTEAVCPHCGTTSTKIIKTYSRTVQHSPIENKEVYLDLVVHHFECETCKNTPGGKKSFTEQLELVEKFQQRTKEFNESILIYLGDNGFSGTERIIEHLGGNVSKSSLARLLSRVEFESPELTHIGIDDVALKKGHVYATIIYDGETEEPVEMLSGRTAELVSLFYQEHKEIEQIDRDRGTSYASAAEETLPEAVQVADRFHLIQGLNDKLKDDLNKSLPKRIIFRGDEIITEEEYKRVRKEKKILLGQLKPEERESLTRDLLYYNHTIKSGNKKRLEILSERFGLSQKKIKSLTKNYSNSSYYSMLETISPESGENPEEVIDFSNYQNITILKRKEVVSYVLAKEENKSAHIRPYIDIIAEAWPEVMEAIETATSFHQAIMGDDVDALVIFIAKHKEGIAEQFIKGLEKDAEAAKNAIRYASSSGYVEGSNCKLKLHKRKGYGRLGIQSLLKLFRLSYLLIHTEFKLVLSERSAKI